MASAKKNKTNTESRDIPIANFLLPIVRRWLDHDMKQGIDYVINWRGKQVKSVGKSWKKYLQRANIQRPIRPYDLRHAYATYSLLAGAKIKIVADIMGHSDPSMILKTYQHTDERERREAIEAMPDYLQLSKIKEQIPGI
jgi:integrase